MRLLYFVQTNGFFFVFAKVGKGPAKTGFYDMLKDFEINKKLYL